MSRLPISAFALSLTIAAPAGALSRTEADVFRDRLHQLQGQPVQILVDELGPAPTEEHQGRRVYNWGFSLVYSHRPAEACFVRATVDQVERIVAGEMRGSDHACGIVLGDLRRTEARYRSNPGLREREAAERARTMERLTGLRRSLSNTAPQ